MARLKPCPFDFWIRALLESYCSSAPFSLGGFGFVGGYHGGGYFVGLRPGFSVALFQVEELDAHGGAAGGDYFWVRP
jgi:hypothetical protein